MKKAVLTLITIATLGAALGGCVVEPVDGVSVGAGQGVILHHGGDTPGAVTLDGRPVVQQTPVIVQPAPVVVEHDHEHEHDHYRDYRDHDRY